MTTLKRIRPNLIKTCFGPVLPEYLNQSAHNKSRFIGVVGDREERGSIFVEEDL